jgi:hypothetical protein
VVPDQHAAFGMQKPTQHVREPSWKDLGMAVLLRKGPPSKAKWGAKTGVSAGKLPR